MSSTTESPFEISVPDFELENLRKKLELVTFPDELEEIGWKYGVPLVDMHRLVSRWREEFNWRPEEENLNDILNQFTRGIHVDEAHGTLNVTKLIPLLTQPESTDFPSFHVVAMSLPGFGFSETPKKSGFSASKHAEVPYFCLDSIANLGALATNSVTQGGDWGFLCTRITRRLAQMYGKTNVKAWHTNYPSTGAIAPTPSQPLLYRRHLFTPYSDAEKAGLERTKWFLSEGMGYNHEQSTQPQTLGYALSDSAVVLTWVSLYYFSRAGLVASLRIYYEATKAGDRVVPPSMTPSIPMGVSHFPKELRRAPVTWIMNVGNLVFSSEHTSGGHFAAHEKPQELAADLRKMFGRGGGVVPGRDGYPTR
ncbi:alpha/beta-hydrolase [Marasmius fiardii PR-910]|nr:alpha/beta-hydrolase [Marasmius fiardii PR-910]